MYTATISDKIKDEAQKIHDNLKLIELADAKGYRSHRAIWKETAPADLVKWWRDTSGEICGNDINDLDEIYELLDTVACILTDSVGAEAGIDEFRDAISEHDFTDVYNADRLEWLLENLSRAGACDEAAEEYGSEGSIYDRIAWGQQRERETYAQEILNALMARLGIEE